MRYHFKSDDGGYEGGNKKYPPEICRIFENKNTHQGGANGSYTGPDSIRSSNWQALRSFNQQVHTDKKANEKSGIPEPCSPIGGFFGLTKTGGKANLKKTCDN